eukprot:432189-Pelagomonas_calceolata.AAC.3
MAAEGPCSPNTKLTLPAATDRAEPAFVCRPTSSQVKTLKATVYTNGRMCALDFCIVWGADAHKHTAIGNVLLKEAGGWRHEDLHVTQEEER